MRFWAIILMQSKITSARAIGQSTLVLAVGALLGSCGSGGSNETAGPGGGPPGIDPPREFEMLVIDPPCPIAGGGYGFSTVPMDWNGDGLLDIGLGAPGEERAYVLLGGGADPFREQLRFDLNGPAGCPTPGSPPGNLGESVTAGDIDGDGDDELVVGAPSTTVDGRLEAGAVYVYGLADLGDAPLVLTTTVEGASFFGSEVRMGDFDADGLQDLAIGESHSLVDGVTAGAVTVVFGVASPIESRVRLPNPAPVANGRFGTHMSIDDGDGDGFPDLYVAALGNTASNGSEFAGQLFVFWGPPTPDGMMVLDDALAIDDDFPRFGMFIHAAGGKITVGAPRKNLLGVPDTGQAFRWEGPSFRAPALFEHPSPLDFDLYGYRVYLADLIGDSRLDQVVVNLGPSGVEFRNPATLYIYDGGENTDDPFVLIPAGDSGSHFAVGMSAGQVVPGGKDELILGDSRYDRPGTGQNEDSGRLVIYF